MVLFVAIFAVIGFTVLRSTHAATGDVNSDGKVDVLDLSVLATNYGKSGKTFSQGDLNGDGSVTVLDLSILAGSWGSVSSGTSIFKTGTVLTNTSLDPYGDSTAVSAGKTLLYNSTYTVSQPWMGFGVNSPSPTVCNADYSSCTPANDVCGSSSTTPPGSLYDWYCLDKRINNGGVVNTSTEEVVLNINAVPGWMRNEPDFHTVPDNGVNYIGHVPTPDHYDDLANMVAAAVQHNSNIKYITVWSEMRGFFNLSTNDWNTADYIAMYNKIWDKIKNPVSAGGINRPDIKIGGPYPSVTSSTKGGVLGDCRNGSPGRSYDSTETYAYGAWGWSDKRDLQVIKDWLRLKHGADFIIFDERNHHDYADESPTLYPECVDRFAQNDKFESTARWIRNLDNTTYPGATTLPIWMVEWYSRWNTPDDTIAIAQQTNQGTEAERAAVMTDGLMKIVKSGLYQRAFLWGPQGEANTNGWMHPLGLFTDTRVSGGGQQTPFYPAQKAINDYFSSGTPLYDVSNTNTAIGVLASNQKLLLVNRSASSQTTVVDGKSLSFTAYEIKLIDR